MGSEQILDGVRSLEDVLVRAGYRTVLEAIAEHTVFLHPDTVAQTHGEALFPVVRTPDRQGRGSIIEWPSGGLIMQDDNTSPTRAFEWAAQRRKGPDVQFNHIFRGAAEPSMYTALWNICVTPAFLAKLTDAQHHAHVSAALKSRSFELYGYVPNGASAPETPDGYDSLAWRDSPPSVADLEHVLRRRLNRAPRSSSARACREIGWYFSGWEPDHTLRDPG